MPLIQQIIQLLSEPPANIVYHLLTLFALQVVFALSLAYWRRERSNHLARRMTWAAGGVLLMRLGLLLAGLVVANDPATAVSVLPPLEQAANTATAVLLVWALVPPLAGQYQLTDTLAVILLLVIGMMYIFFAQSWPEQALSGTAYNSTTQATIWSASQLLVLVVGVILTMAERPLWFSLRQFILVILLITHLIHFWHNPEIAATQTDVAYWIRLGYLIALPLWAVFAYRHTQAAWLVSRPRREERGQQVTAVLHLATQAINSLQTDQNALEVLHIAGQLLPAPYVALVLTRPENGQHLHVVSNQAEPAGSQPANWTINLANWSAFQQALDERETIELRPTGLGSRQLRLWYEEMGLSLWGAMLVLPLQMQNRNLGLLLLGAGDNRAEWPAEEKAIANALARYVAQILHNSYTFAQAADHIAETPPVITPIVAPPPTQVSGRLIAMEEERDRLKSDLETTSVRLTQAETQAAKATKQAHDLAATLQELENVSYDERVALLEKEIESLRESLIQAEEAMALAAAGEGGLSTEWIMTTITRYSGQLEAAQARIQTLEADLLRRERGVSDELVVSLAQELRTPMTSIAGYTDLLLSEMLGGLGAKQRDFLQRVKANVERMDAFLDLIVQLTTSNELLTQASGEGVDIRTVVDTAVSTIITQIREKKLRLDLEVPANLPLLTINREAVQKILTNLLGNACQASKANSRIVVSAYVNALNPPAPNGHIEPIRFVHLAVTDSGGGIPVADRARVFAPQHRADHPLITGLGDTGAGLAVARTLAEANGGRVWIESKMGIGSTLSVLFPLAAEPRPVTESK